jgi:type I restriction enzyme, S subunit
LGEVCLPVPIIQPEDSPNAEYTYLDIGGIDNESNRIVETKTIYGRNAPSRARQAVRKDDILFSTVRTYLRKIARVEQDYPNPIASTGFTVIRTAAGVCPQFLFFQILSEAFLKPLHLLQTGSNYPAVRSSDVFAQSILVPPVAEQESIVSKLTATLSALERGQMALRKVQEGIDKYRATVLTAAVTGEVTRNWRANQRQSKGPNTETAEILLQRLLAARRTRWEELELERLREKGDAAIDDKWKSRYLEPAQPRVDDPPELPDSWAWASVDQLAAHDERSITDGPFGSNLKSSHYTDSGPRVVRLQNIGDAIFLDERAHISQKHYESLKHFAIHAGDLVIRALGTPAPRACKIPASLGPAIVKADCIRFKVASEYISPDYVLWALNSPPVQTRTAKMIHGVGRPRLNLSEIKSIALPVPSSAEQTEIVREVERRLSAADSLARTSDRQLELARSLRESLMNEAFTGHFVSQNPHDEPASTLLERIRTTREAEIKKLRENRMTKRKSSRRAPTRRPLLAVLRESVGPMTPEELFRVSGHSQESVDFFFAELRELTASPAKVVEERNLSGQTLLKVVP